MNGRPHFLIIGAMKCATSTLHEQLAAQPGIFMSTPKEIHYFSNDEIYGLGWEWYNAHFAPAQPGDLCGESSTHYTKLPTYPHTVVRIASHLPQARFIYVMRHPVERLISQYIHQWTEREIEAPLTVAVEQQAELTAYSLYARQLAPYLETFGRERVLPVFVERLRRAPQAELERIAAFIGYEPTPTWSERVERQNASAGRMRHSAWRDKVVYAPGISWVRQHLVPPATRDRLKQRWQMRRRPRLAAEQVRQLTAVFDADLALLGEWLGIRLNCANFDEKTSQPDVDWCERPQWEPTWTVSE